MSKPSKSGKAPGSTRKPGKPPEPSKPSARTRKAPEPPVRTAALIDKTDVNRHLLDRQKKLYNVHHGKCLVDFADKKAAREWPGYVVLPNGDQGPLFRNVSEMKEYCRRYEFKVEGING